jgi:hypothetical protein
VTSLKGWGSLVTFCADTTLLVCVRRDGFEPRVREGKYDDPRCEVFARGDEVREAAAAFLRAAK